MSTWNDKKFTVKPFVNTGSDIQTSIKSTSLISLRCYVEIHSPPHNKAENSHCSIWKNLVQ